MKPDRVETKFADMITKQIHETYPIFKKQRSEQKPRTTTDTETDQELLSLLCA